MWIGLGLVNQNFPLKAKSVVFYGIFIVFFHTLTLATSNNATSKAVPEYLSHCSSAANEYNSSVNVGISAQCLLNARKVAGTQPLDNNDLIPKWANLTLAAIGQNFASRNIGYLGVSHFFALIFENFIPDIKDVLITTGSSSSVERAVKRYTATATQVLLWYRNSLTSSTQKEILLNSIRNVRRLHLDGAFKAQIRLQNSKFMDLKRKEIIHQFKTQYPRSIVNDERFWLALEKDLVLSNIPKSKRHFPDWNNNTGTPISQFSQSLTEFSFGGIPVLFHRELGISHVSNEELYGYVHLWAVLGHALGIKDEFNICKNQDLNSGKKLFRQILDTYFIPAMFTFDWRVRVQLGAYLDALQRMDQAISPRLIMYRFLRDIVKIRPLNIFQQMTAIERIYLSLVDSLMSNNLDANRFIMNQGGMFFLDVNGYNNFGNHYSSDERKSRGAFYTREELVV